MRQQLMFWKKKDNTAAETVTPASASSALLSEKENKEFAKRFDPSRLWRKIIGSGRKAGFQTIELALTLYYTARAPETPVWCKTAIYGALGYFISLVDAIPDLTPVLGYTDDVGVMLSALAMLSAYVTPEIRTKARKQAIKLLPQDVTPEPADAPGADSPQQALDQSKP
ncbi:YkvA family protein [Allohahella marinimesophila]|uniref:DUF1232 domain-containing protein n=1 Tax=Allohahella marinimesophila TaxID=1054972 RepID=A0ABP7PZ33_9GAMM